MAPITVFIQRSISVAVARGTSWTNMERLKVEILTSDGKHITPKPELPPICTDLAPSSSPMDKDEDVKAIRYYLEHHFSTCRRHRGHRKDEKLLSASSRWAKLDESPCNPKSDSHPTNHKRSWRGPGRLPTGQKCYKRWVSAPVTHCTTTTTTLAINLLSLWTFFAKIFAE